MRKFFCKNWLLNRISVKIWNHIYLLETAPDIKFLLSSIKKKRARMDYKIRTSTKTNENIFTPGLNMNSNEQQQTFVEHLV